MTTVHFDDIVTPAGRSWLARLWTRIYDWQAARAQRVIDSHAALIADLNSDAASVAATRDGAWSALLHGATCEAGLRADPPARDFSAL